LTKLNLEVCFTPASFEKYKNGNAVVVVLDVLRASSSICAAFMNGAEKIIPVRDLDEARAYKAKGFKVAAERDGLVQDFADFGNSPYNFSPQNVKGETIVYSTTNGTNTIMMASTCHAVLVGAYLNLSAVVEWCVKSGKPVIISCAGWKDKFSLEDSLCAGAFCQALIDTGNFVTHCDSALAAMDLWEIGKSNILGYIEKAAQRHRLKKHGLDDVLEYCHTIDITKVVPILSGDSLIQAN
jgi:2-phosphosulfolactate phosphatase